MKLLAFTALVLSSCATTTPPPSSPPPSGPAVDGPTAREERRDDRRDETMEDMTGWAKLGEAWVDGARDKDRIHVGRDDGKFRAIRLKAEHSALELYDVKIEFGNGEWFAPATTVGFAKGEWSDVIDLPGGNRAIRNIDLRYRNLPGGGKAQLEVWGI